MKRLFSNMGWLLGGRGFNAVLSLVYLALATRALGTVGFGHFALIVALGQAITGLANFQTWQFIVRWGASGDGGSVDPEKAREATGFAIALDLVSVVLGIALAGVVIASAPYWLEVPANLLWLAFGYCVVSLAAIRTTPTGILRLHFQYARAAGAEAVQPIIRAAGSVLAFLLMPTVTGFIIAYAVAEIAVAVALWVVAARVQPVSWSAVSLKAIPARYKDAWRFVVATNLSGSLSIAGKQVMILLVGTFGGAALAGGFRVASQLGQALVSLAQTVSKAILPELVHSRDRSLELARRMANIAAIGGVIAVVTALLFGRLGLELIAGEEFGVFYWAMVILAIAGAVELVGASLESLLVSAGKAHVAFIVRAVPTVLALVLLDAAIDWNGAKGAAFALLGSSSLAVIGFYVAILNLGQIRLIVEDEGETGPQPVPPPQS
ncbi:lipopolysaccharide biosynthesis protein [Erythrobacter dokdonensis]|jgi:O-antigen/teichoic acid export membrane protein|uniref:Polysaccharide biosynthesis protein n=1 Tax=Erythrobacter dokdonensis DSW-74 TaxID=1300349 RepID=A0A1A7BFJ1_9SPHN|nr:lipopolysaccharide biosynthesis protein [Erythrobacter dokdonensis]MEE4317566.1 lipopolysaccharide biosynthesis protein [Erythrobacter sp.]OBV10177.1 Polysaccharide biosynthesis protein [Erythrobacter dokdonensis DSW-74]